MTTEQAIELLSNIQIIVNNTEVLKGFQAALLGSLFAFALLSFTFMKR